VEYGIEDIVESISKRVESEAWLIVIFNSLNSRQFVFVDPTHEFPRVLTLVGYLLNLDVEEDSFGSFDQFLERFPVSETS